MAQPSQQAQELKIRSQRFALDVIRLCRNFPKSIDGYVVAKQLIRCATATAANYRAACSARSPGDFVSRISVVSEEADESEFWLDIAIASQMVSSAMGGPLLREAGELTAIFRASRTTAKRNAGGER